MRGNQGRLKRIENEEVGKGKSDSRSDNVTESDKDGSEAMGRNELEDARGRGSARG